MISSSSTAHLYLDGINVGTIDVRGWHGAWGFGDFSPNDAFAEFAPRFAHWAKLFHDADSSRQVSRQLAGDLRQAEYALYRIKGHIHLPEFDRWRTIALLNIDGGLIEWKEGATSRPLITQPLMEAAKIAS